MDSKLDEYMFELFNRLYEDHRAMTTTELSLAIIAYTLYMVTSPQKESQPDTIN